MSMTQNTEPEGHVTPDEIDLSGRPSGTRPLEEGAGAAAEPDRLLSDSINGIEHLRAP